MALNKEAYLRYKIIDSCIADKNNPYPSLYNIIDRCTNALGKEFHPSTILKDIAALKTDELLGFLAPIKFSKAYNGYYYTDKEYQMHKINLNENEIDSIKTMLGVLNTFTGTSINENFNQAVHKIFVSLQEKFPEEEQKIIQSDATPAQRGFEYFELFLKAAREKKPVSFVHYSFRKREFNAEIVSVYCLKEFQSKWFFIGYSENEKRIKTFSFESIYDPFLLQHPFMETEKENINNHFNNMYGVYPIKNQGLQKIKFQVLPYLSDYLTANPIHKSQERFFEFQHGMALFSLDLIPTHSLIDFFLLHNRDLVVITPKWLSDRLKSNHIKSYYHEKK